MGTGPVMADIDLMIQTCMGCMVEVEKVLDSWNLVPREFFVSKKFSQKFLQKYDVELIVILNYNTITKL